MFYSDDPVADAERYIAHQEEKLKMLPKCSECCEPIQESYCYEFDGELICKECLIAFHRKAVD